MFSYTEILKKAYYITRENALLWFFGLFVIGGFSLNFLHFVKLANFERQMPFSWADSFLYLQYNPLILAALGFGAVCVFAAVLFLTNWLRIIIISLTLCIIDKKPVELLKRIKLSGRFIVPFIKVSLLTSLLMILVAVALLGAPLWSSLDFSAKILLWILASFIFVPLAFTILSVKIFTGFFVVLFKHDFQTALNLATDLYISNWIKILGLGLILGVIFLAGSAGGGLIVFLGRLIERYLLLFGGGLGFFGNSAIIFAVRGLTAAFLWLILAFTNIFFNTSLLLLFLKLVTPIKTEEKAEAKHLEVFPAVL